MPHPPPPKTRSRQRPASPRAVPETRKWLVAMVAACVVLGLLAGGWWYARGPRRPTLLPGGLVLEHLSAQIVLRDSRPRSPWSRYLELRQRAEALANSEVPCEIGFWDLAEPGKPQSGTRWQTVALHNPGFVPRAVFEHPASGGSELLLGFFAADGQPLTVDRRRYNNDPNSGRWLLHPKPPLTPGETRPVIHVERIPTPFKPASNGTGWELDWNGASGNRQPPLVQLRALRLPMDATWILREGTPEPEVLKGEPPVLFWLAKPGEPLPAIRLTATWPDK